MHAERERWNDGRVGRCWWTSGASSGVGTACVCVCCMYVYVHMHRNTCVKVGVGRAVSVRQYMRHLGYCMLRDTSVTIRRRGHRAVLMIHTHTHTHTHKTRTHTQNTGTARRRGWRPSPTPPWFGMPHSRSRLASHCGTPSTASGRAMDVTSPPRSVPVAAARPCKP